MFRENYKCFGKVVKARVNEHKEKPKNEITDPYLDKDRISIERLIENICSGGVLNPNQTLQVSGKHFKWLPGGGDGRAQFFLFVLNFELGFWCLNNYFYFFGNRGNRGSDCDVMAPEIQNFFRRRAWDPKSCAGSPQHHPPTEISQTTFSTGGAKQLRAASSVFSKYFMALLLVTLQPAKGCHISLFFNYQSRGGVIVVRPPIRQWSHVWARNRQHSASTTIEEHLLIAEL